MSALQRLMSAAAAGLVVSLGACSDSSSPSTVDAVALQSSLSAATSTFEQNAAFQSISILSASFPQFAGVSVAMPSLSRILRTPANLRNHPRSTIPFAAAPQALFPSNALGKTLEWNTGAQMYIIGNQAGAPANGIRIILYFADQSTGQPTPNLAVLGYLDLTDQSTPQLNQLGLLLRLASTTIAEYTITVITGTNTGSAEAKGYMKDGTATVQVGFDFLNSLLASGDVNSSNDLTGNDGAAIHTEIDLSGTDITDNVVARITKGHNTAEVSASGDFLNGTGNLTGGVKFNGITVATVGGTPETPILTGAGGHTLTAGETSALLSIFTAAIEDVLRVSDGVFGPGAIVFHQP
ncbi:MAG TPA: hypothetical protein VGI92_09675 [Gemmatimonadales bacterium]|jgi:hypothetical protein